MIRLALRVRREEAEVVLAELLELAPRGVEEVDVDAEVVEYAVYGAPGELPDLPDLRAAAGGAFVEVRTTEVADDWAQRWRAFHEPVAVGGRLWLRAPWHDARPDLEDVVVDPGQAFGTGAHPTTRLCLEALVGLACEGRASGPLVDLGCGSGVLGVAAAKLGWGPVDGFDHEAESVAATRENAARNEVAVEAHRWDLRHDEVAVAPTMTANLLRPLLLVLAERLAHPPSVLVASGLLAQEADEVAAVYAARLGLEERRRLADGGWVALVLECP